MIAEKLLALLFSFAILGNALAVRRAAGTWLFPAALFALFWFAFTLLPLVLLFSAPVNPWAVAYILAGTIAFSISGLVYFRWQTAFRANRAKPSPLEFFDTPLLRVVFAGAAVLSIPCFLLNMRAQGFSISDLWSNAFSVASSYAVMRYTETLSFSIYSRIGIVLAYLAATTGGLLFGSVRSGRQKAVILAGAFTPAVAPLLFESAKGLLFFFIVLFFAGVLVTRIFRGRFYLADRTTIRNTVLAVALLAPLTLASFLSRGLYAVQDSVVLGESLTQYAATYAFGHLYAFSDWFSFRTGFPSTLGYASDPTGYGFYTLTPLFRLAGSARTLPIGIYDETFSYGGLILTNIYTIFRGLVIDFGLGGALVALFVAGWLIHLNYYVLLFRRRPGVSVAFFIYSIGFVYMSFALSMLTWNVVPVVMLALAGCLAINARLRTQSDPKRIAGVALARG